MSKEDKQAIDYMYIILKEQIKEKDRRIYELQQRIEMYWRYIQETEQRDTFRRWYEKKKRLSGEIYEEPERSRTPIPPEEYFLEESYFCDI